MNRIAITANLSKKIKRGNRLVSKAEGEDMRNPNRQSKTLKLKESVNRRRKG